MRRRQVAISLLLLTAGVVALPVRQDRASATSSAAGTLAQKHCKVVVKKVHGRKKKVRVCVKHPTTPTRTPTRTPTLTPTPTPTPTSTTPALPEDKQFGVWYFESTDWSLQADIGRMQYFHAKGQTVVEVAPVWDWVQPTAFAPLSPKAAAGIRSILDAAQQTGEQVILTIGDFSRYPANGPPLTRAQAPAFADVWGRIAEAFHDHPALFGYELMNEPANLPEGPDAWAYLAQAATDAIRRYDLSAWVLIPGYQAQNATTWAQNNPHLDIHDTANRLIYSAHIFFDSDFSGNYRKSYDDSGAYPNIGVDRVKPFLDWLEVHHALGMVTSYGVPDDDPRWLVVLDRFLHTLDDDRRILGGVYFCAATDCGDLSVEPIGGVDQPQMSILQQHPSHPLQPAPSLTATPTPSTAPVPISKGSLVWQAPLDGSGNDIWTPYDLGTPGSSTIRTDAGAIEVTVSSCCANTGAGFRAPSQGNYVVELDLSVRRGSAIDFDLNLMDTADNKHYVVRINAADEVMQLVYVDWNAQPAQDYLGPLVRVPGLQTGQAFTIGAVVNPPHLSLYLNGLQVADIDDTRISTQGAPGFTVSGTRGQVRVLGARVYRLA